MLLLEKLISTGQGCNLSRISVDGITRNTVKKNFQTKKQVLRNICSLLHISVHAICHREKCYFDGKRLFSPLESCLRSAKTMWLIILFYARKFDRRWLRNAFIVYKKRMTMPLFARFDIFDELQCNWPCHTISIAQPRQFVFPSFFAHPSRLS